MVLSMRFERMTCSLGGSRSIQLSYESLPKRLFSCSSALSADGFIPSVVHPFI